MVRFILLPLLALTVPSLAEESPVPRLVTPDFTVDIDDRFTVRRGYGSQVLARMEPQTLTSPQMSFWTSERDGGAAMDAQLAGQDVEERGLRVLNGNAADVARVRDVIEDDGATLPWYRLRAQMMSPDREKYLHATAMASAADLAWVEPAFIAAIGSIGDGGEPSEAEPPPLRMPEALVDTVTPRLVATASALPTDTAEQRFAAAVAAAGFADRATAVRAIAAPAYALIEAGEDDGARADATLVGGGATLAKGTDWPRDPSGFHLNFLAQVNLAEIDAVTPIPEAALPRDGLLSFFTGTDYSDWRVVYTPAGRELVVHPLDADAEATAMSARGMVTWNSETRRFDLTTAAMDGLTGEIEPDGRVRFLRDGAPVIALSSDNDIGWSRQRLAVVPTLMLPYQSPAYAEAGIDDPYPLWEAVDSAMKVGDGPQHHVLGVAGLLAEGDWSATGLAVRHAREQGWDDLTDPSDWFVLMVLKSGGAANYSFSDHGDYIFLANRKDAAEGDFSRVFAFVESG